MKKHMRVVALVSTIGVTVFTGVLLLSTSIHADGVVSVVNITVPVSCTMEGSGMNSHNAEIPNGTTVENIGTTTLKAYCNDNEGFSIYASGFSDDTLGNTYLRSADVGSSFDIITGTTFSGTSQWAMKIGATVGTYAPIIAGSTADDEKQSGDVDYSTWAEVPSAYARVAYRNSSTDIPNESIASAEGASITVTYKAFVNITQPAGTYTGKVKFTMVHPASAVPSNIPDSVTPPESCPDPVPNLIYMQDLKSSNKASVLAGMTEDAQYFLADKRDDKSYCVSKLRDGNIWMTQNLDLDLVTDGSIVYNSETTDLPSDTVWVPSAATISLLSWDRSYDEPVSRDPGDLYWDGEVSFYNKYPSSTGDSHYHLGNYYNWAAAVASNSATDYATYNEETGEYDNLLPNQSICPAGWTLPVGYPSTSNGSFAYLVEQYGWDSETQSLGNDIVAYGSPMFYTLSTEVGEFVATVADYWAANAIGPFGDGYDGAASVHLNNNVIVPDDYYDRMNPENVRCVSR